MSPQPDRKANKRKTSLAKEAEMNQSRVAWVDFNGNEFILYDISQADDVEDSEKGGLSVYLRFRWMRSVIRWALTPMTEAELLAVKQFFDLAFERALPVVRERDAEARRAWEEEGVDYQRLYRRAPQFIVRERRQREHGEGVPSRPSDVGGVDASQPDSEPGGSSEKLHHGDSEDIQAEDNRSEDNGPS